MLKKAAVFLISSLLAWPLISQAVPYIGFFFFLLAGSLLIVNINFWSSDSALFFWKTSISRLLVLLNITFFYGMSLALSAVTFSVFKDGLRGVVYFLTWLTIVQIYINCENSYSKAIVIYFSRALLWGAFAIAVLGLVKYGMSMEGVYWTFLVSEPILYPWGTSLVGDYNFYSLTLIIGGLIILRHWAGAASSLHAVMYSCMFALVYCAGWLAGSRRFWIVTPILIPLYLICISRIGKKANIRLQWREFVVGVLLIFSLLLIYKSLSNSVCGEVVDKTELGSYSDQIRLRGEDLVGSNGLRALSPRMDRWLLALETGGVKNKIIGVGFDYRNDFGCVFNRCKVEDYPHAPILSALLYGGVFAALVTSFFFFYALFIAYQAIKYKILYSDLAFGLVATVLFASISGDTLFSIPVFFSMLAITRLALYVEQE